MKASISMASGTVARFVPDPLDERSVILEVDGAEQSHVRLEKQEEIFYEYLHRAANVIDAHFAPGRPLRALHLGAGALTLPRRLAVTRPGSEQVVVDIERELIGFVLKHVPLPDGAHVHQVVADAREHVQALLEAGGPRELFDVVVLDIFTGPDSPEHLADGGFYREMARLLGGDGLLIVNLGDDEGMRFAREQLRVLQGVFADVLATGTSELFTTRYAGNIVAAAARTPFPGSLCEAVTAAGPHPGTTLAGTDLDGFAAQSPGSA
ncbi:hypothetical protein EV380_1134 [Zhihengliuella halotolerans]|uniref:Spermidine synthase n=2 Tax=Zhihengliuella halotolerans TaxID=370736 RepID=A0A4Q8AD62_9MICC|nr:hypothetical protein EV380_1134 [Zhihengliuella halotolerans]